MKTTTHKPKNTPSRPVQHTPQPARQNLPNSALLAASGARNRGSEDLEAKMMARMQSFRDAQIPTAEREADAIASTVNPTASVEEVKSTLGQKLGADFSKVSIHTGAGARDMADSMGADAYTKGTDVYLGEGASNARTVAHELVHTVQQGGVSGFGVSQSAAFGTVQMKPGKRARLKNWFKRKFGISRTTVNDNGETVTDNGAGKIIEPEAMVGTNIFDNMNKTSELNKLQNYNHTDKTAKVRQMEAGAFDSHFDALETDEERVHELQRLAQYLSAARKESKGKLSDHDLSLEQTYKSSLQKASGSDSFMKELMRQSVEASIAMREKSSAVDADQANIFERKHNYSYKEILADKEKAELCRKEQGEESKAMKRARYDRVVDSEEGRRFNALRFMMGDAAGLMIDGERRANWNELRRQRFSSKQIGDGDIREKVGANAVIGTVPETKGQKGVHKGQEKILRPDGTSDYTDISRYVSEMRAGNNVFRFANSASGSGDVTNVERHKARNKDYIAGYRLPGQR